MKRRVKASPIPPAKEPPGDGRTCPAGRKAALRFAARFVLCLCVLYAVAGTPGVRQGLDTCCRADASVASWWLGLFGQGAEAKGSAVISSRFGVSILPECTNSEAVWLLAAAVCAFPTTVARKLVGVAFVAFAVAVVNLFRIVSVFLVGVYRGGWFNLVHEQIWGGVNVLALVGIAMVWIHWATRDGQERAAAAPKVGLSRKLIGFFGRFALCFSIGFVAQWLGIAEPCGACFRSIATSVFSRADGRREIDFERLGERDTRIEIVNRVLMKPDGSGPVRNLDVRTGGAVWLPFCIYAALVWASSISLRHCAGALALGVLAWGGLLLVVTGFAIWNNSTEVGLVALSPAWKSVADVTQMRLQDFCGMGAPVVLWVLLAFHRAGLVRGARRAGA